MGLLDINLPKWPGLLVRGDDVEWYEAHQIILRTSCLQSASNDLKWARKLWDLAGIEQSQRSSFLADSESYLAYEKRHGVLDLYYLRNKRVWSSWVGGPHGWCDWDGTIGSCCYNIGKWPSVGEVYKEWQVIAEAFPYLNLRSQLLNVEITQTEDEPWEPLVEFTVRDGIVNMTEPSEPLMQPEPADWTLPSRSLIHERGCSEGNFERALKMTRR